MNMNYLYKVFPHVHQCIDHIIQFHNNCGDAQETYWEAKRLASKFSTSQEDATILLRVASDLEKHLTRYYLDMYLDEVEAYESRIEAHVLQELERAIELGTTRSLPTLTKKEFWTWMIWKKLQFRRRKARHFLRLFDKRFFRYWGNDTWERDYLLWNRTVEVFDWYKSRLFDRRRASRTSIPKKPWAYRDGDFYQEHELRG